MGVSRPPLPPLSVIVSISPTPPPPFVSHSQPFPNPPPPYVSFVSICRTPPSSSVSVLWTYFMPPSSWITFFLGRKYINWQKILIYPDELDKNLYFLAIVRHFSVILALARPPRPFVIHCQHLPYPASPLLHLLSAFPHPTLAEILWNYQGV